jgi:hypothetical protein
MMNNIFTVFIIGRFEYLTRSEFWKGLQIGISEDVIKVATISVARPDRNNSLPHGQSAGSTGKKTI